MEERGHILKRAAMKALSVESKPDAGTSAARNGRLRAREVAAEPLEDAGSYPRTGVVKKQRAVVEATPYELAAVEYTADFPLPSKEGEDAVDLEARLEKRMAEQEAAWQARLEEAVVQAREEGRAEGYAKARAELEAEFEAREAVIKEEVSRLKAAWKEFLQKSEILLAHLAFEVAQQLLEGPLPQDIKAVSTQALSQAIEQLGGQVPVEVSLHPDDLARLEAYGLTIDLQEVHGTLQWRSDPDLKPGEWIVQTPEAAVRRLREEVLAHLKSRLGLLAAMKSRRERQEQER